MKLIVGFRLNFIDLISTLPFRKAEEEEIKSFWLCTINIIYTSDHEVSKLKNKSATKRSGECSGSGNISKKKCYISAFKERTSSNFADVKNLEVADNTGASKTVSFASSVSEIDFELTDLIIQDATPVSAASSTPMQNKEKLAIDTDETKYSDTSKELLQMYKGTMH